MKHYTQRIDLTGSQGRALIIGDVHGCFDVLRAELEAVGYDAAKDTLLFLGDLVDRGPQSAEFGEWLHHPRIMGNHEVMLADAANSELGAIAHRRAGGDWFDAFEGQDRAAAARTLTAAPLAIELVTPAGRSVGLVHADVAGDSWRDFYRALVTGPDDRAGQYALWSGMRFDRAAKGEDVSVAGIDHVFFGHSEVDAPMTSGNCSWVDTGAAHSGRIAIIDVDAWLEARTETRELLAA